MRGMIIAILVIVSLAFLLSLMWFASWVQVEVEKLEALEKVNSKDFEGGYDSEHESTSAR